MSTKSIPLYLFYGVFLISCTSKQEQTPPEKQRGVAVLLVDTDRETGVIKPHIYGHFLEHINHSVVDGLYAEQIRGQGFESNDFETYWKVTETGKVTVSTTGFANGELSMMLEPNNSSAGIFQSRLYLQKDTTYDGSLWVKATGNVELLLKISDPDGIELIALPLNVSKGEWTEIPFSFVSPKTITDGTITLLAKGDGNILIDFISLMSAEARKNGMLRQDLLLALQALKPPFVRWPGGSFASIYNWKNGIGPQVNRKFTPNSIWGNYSDYYGFGTDEFLELSRQLEAEPMIVLKATSTDPEEVQNAMDWVHYLIDPPTTEWGKVRAENGHPEPYRIPYFQIDNEPMNNGFNPDEYADLVNVFGSKLREIAPDSRIVACGQKRSNDMVWTQKVVDIAGSNFDILGVHNYEYEPENYQSGVRRIENYLIEAEKYIRNSSYPDIHIGVLEWGLCRSFDWRAGLHAAGSLISYEKLSPKVEMSCPALLMRNTTDDPEWRAFIYHDHVSWFPGSGYVVEKLFREHFAPRQLAATSGTFKDLEDRRVFFDDISQMKPEDWNPGTVDAIATGDADGSRIVIKAVNYESYPNTLLIRLQGSSAPSDADVTIYTLSANLTDQPSMEEPNKIATRITTIPYASDLAFDLDPYSVMVAVITKK